MSKAWGDNLHAIFSYVVYLPIEQNVYQETTYFTKLATYIRVINLSLVNVKHSFGIFESCYSYVRNFQEFDNIHCS